MEIHSTTNLPSNYSSISSMSASISFNTTQITQTPAQNSTASIKVLIPHQDSALDDLLMKMVTLSLVVHYIPVKKLTMLYTRVLANLFHHSSPLPPLSPKYIYSDNDAAQLPLENLLRFGQLEKLKNTHPPINSPHSDKAPPIERYYVSILIISANTTLENVPSHSQLSLDC